MRSLLPLLATLWLILGCVGKDAASVRPSAEQAARELERGLLAPCCWRETLDVHTSPQVTELRAEIRRRLAQGESGGQIEADLVARYGARMRAHLPGSLGSWLVVLVGVVGGLLLYSLRRRRASPPPPAPSDAAPARGEQASRTDSADKEYEWQLDQDLSD